MKLEGIHALIESAESGSPRFPPTLVFNEGWMLRLILAWFSTHQVSGHPLNFEPGATWFSEALLPSPFLPRYRGDKRAEGRTHADGILGHISVGSAGKADTSLLRGAAQLVVAEAKMFSPMSAGTRNAPTYDQAARNVACIAETLCRADAPPGQFRSLGFYVLTPDAQAREIDLTSKVDKVSIQRAVFSRAGSYGDELDPWLSEWFAATLADIHIGVLSWEQLVDDVRSQDGDTGASLASFYAQSLTHNAPGSSEVPA